MQAWRGRFNEALSSTSGVVYQWRKDKSHVPPAFDLLARRVQTYRSPMDFSITRGGSLIANMCTYGRPTWGPPWVLRAVCPHAGLSPNRAADTVGPRARAPMGAWPK